MAGGALAPTMVSSTTGGASLLAVLLSHPDIVWHHVCTMVGVGTGQLVIPWYRGLPSAQGAQWFAVVHRVVVHRVVVHSGSQ